MSLNQIIPASSNTFISNLETKKMNEHKISFLKNDIFQSQSVKNKTSFNHTVITYNKPNNDKNKLFFSNNKKMPDKYSSIIKMKNKINVTSKNTNSNNSNVLNNIFNYENFNKNTSKQNKKRYKYLFKNKYYYKLSYLKKKNYNNKDNKNIIINDVFTPKNRITVINIYKTLESSNSQVLKKNSSFDSFHSFNINDYNLFNKTNRLKNKNSNNNDKNTNNNNEYCSNIKCKNVIKIKNYINRNNCTNENKNTFMRNQNQKRIKTLLEKYSNIPTEEINKKNCSNFSTTNININNINNNNIINYNEKRSEYNSSNNTNTNTNNAKTNINNNKENNNKENNNKENNKENKKNNNNVLFTNKTITKSLSDNYLIFKNYYNSNGN